jgi:hypothetical protein
MSAKIGGVSITWEVIKSEPMRTRGVLSFLAIHWTPPHATNRLSAPLLWPGSRSKLPIDIHPAEGSAVRFDSHEQ